MRSILGILAVLLVWSSPVNSQLFTIVNGRTAAGGATFDPLNTDSHLTLSNNNKTATGTQNATWFSTIATGTGRVTGKYYFRIKVVPVAGSYGTAGICTKTEPTNTLIGSDANGWLAYAQLGQATGSIYHSGGNVGVFATGSPNLASGDYVVVAFDGGNGKVWFTGQTAAGVLQASWDNTTDNPSTNTGGFSTGGAALLPGASIIDSSGAGDTETIDTTSVISHSTLSGFSPWH